MAEPYVPREQFSVSGLSLWENCRRAWGFRYLFGLKDVELTWEQIETGVPHTSRQKAKAFGGALHKVLETYYTGGEPDWQSAPGRLALVGIPLLPRPEECNVVLVEHSVTIDTTPYVRNDADDPIVFQGFKDLTVQIGTWRGLFDYKSTIDFKWAHTPLTLVNDWQCNVYAYDVMSTAGTASIDASWIYFLKKGLPCAKPVDVTVQRDRAKAITYQVIMRAQAARDAMRQFVAGVIDVDDLTPNPRHCPAYGGCPYHISAGGLCDARAKQQSTISEVIPMGTFQERMAKMKAQKDAAAAAAQATAQPAAQPAAVAAAAPVATATPKRGRPPKATVAPVESVVTGEDPIKVTLFIEDTSDSHGLYIRIPLPDSLRPQVDQIIEALAAV